MEIYNIFKRVPYMTDQLLKSESLDRLDSVVDELPKYKNEFHKLNNNFTNDNMLKLLYIIHKDKEFKLSKYYNTYNIYFDEIEELIFKNGD